MTDFLLYKNSSQININYSYLIDVQSNLLSDLKTRLVIPLIKKSEIKSNIKLLNPEIIIENIEYVILTQQMAAVPISYLGKQLINITVDRTKILSAIDFLITGF